jgi:predicted O-linked N-acetylglucosamine transferase (SPINDLY family)
LWLLKDNELAVANLRQEAVARGIDPHRLVFVKKVRPSEHFNRLRLADLFLDTLPYNAHAHTTARDALWSGLPLITCQGDTFAGRVAASLLHAVHLPDLVTHSVVEYEALTLRSAHDKAALAALKRKLAGNLQSLPLFDTNRLRRHIEAAYHTMWNIHLAGERPRSFAVEPIAAP